MQKNKQSSRSLIAFLVTWSFLVLTLTGIVLYIVPQGRIAHWVHWSLAGMGKDQWGWVHMMFGGVFIVTGVLHLYFNWKPFKGYLAARVKGHLELKREILVATGLTVLLFAVSAANLPPASWVIALNGWIKDAWVTSPEAEPPFGHAEEVSLAALLRRMGLDRDAAVAALVEAGITYDSLQDSLQTIAVANGTTPMAVYALIRSTGEPAVTAGDRWTAEAIEARFAGTGLGRKPLAELCRSADLDETGCRARLAGAGIQVTGDDTVKAIADRHGLSPVDLMKILLLPAPDVEK